MRRHLSIVVLPPVLVFYLAAGAAGLYRYIDNYWLYRGFGPPRDPAFVKERGTTEQISVTSAALGFQRGGALQTAGVATLLTNALPIAAGALVFGEPIPSGPAGVARILAFACVVAGAAFLARAPGTEERRRLGSVRWRAGSGRFRARRPGSTASGSPSSTRPTT
jgi:hypothetical protein